MVSVKKAASVDRRSTPTKGAPAKTRSNPALDAFERAMKALSRKDFSRARDLFDGLLEGYPDERDLLERVRAYRTVCDRALGKRPPKPKTFDELVSHGVYHHNRGEYAEALRFLHQAAEIHPRNEGLLYCLAASAARAGDAPAAIKALRGAISANASNRTQARTDADFDSLREHADFLSLIA